MPARALELDRPELVGGLPARQVLVLAREASGRLVHLLAALRPAVAVECCEQIAQAVECLRNRPLEAILIASEPGSVPAGLVDPLRAGGGDDVPILAVGDLPEREAAEAWQQAGADGYLYLADQSPATLSWHLRRAMELRRLAAENRRLRQSERRRLEHEHEEIEHLLVQQHALLENLETIQAASRDEFDRPLAVKSLAAGEPRASANLPVALVRQYRELLQALVVMGTGSLSGEMQAVVGELLAANVSAQRAMLLHLEVVEEMVRGLGNRSARHVLNRADLLVVEVLMHLAEAWRERAGEAR